MVKRKIHGTSRVAKQAENIMLNIAYDSQARRGAVDFQGVPADSDANFRYQVNMRDLDVSLSLSAMLLCNYYGTPAITEQNINCAKPLALGVHFAIIDVL